MKTMKLLHKILVMVYTTLNAIWVYLFLMQLPYGFDPLFVSLRYWNELSPRIGIVSGLAIASGIAGVVLTTRLSEMWKNRLLYFRWRYPHPAHDAFLASRKQPFDSKQLLAAYPEVKDGGLRPEVQIECWERIAEGFKTHPVVQSTGVHWAMLRDLYVLSLFFLLVFLIGLPLNFGVPMHLVSIYLFLFGAQFLFLLFSARKVGIRHVDNVLGLDQGVEVYSSRKRKKGGKG